MMVLTYSQSLTYYITNKSLHLIVILKYKKQKNKGWWAESLSPEDS